MKRSIMNTTDIGRYEAILQDKKWELSVGLRRRWDIAAVSSPDSVEEVQLTEVRELEIDSLDRRAGLLREVEDALSRISDGSFGVCRLCDANIKPARLNAVPWAPLCIECQEDAERKRGTNDRFFYNAFDDAA
jgi:DnaK suppressor protein